MHAWRMPGERYDIGELKSYDSGPIALGWIGGTGFCTWELNDLPDIAFICVLRGLTGATSCWTQKYPGVVRSWGPLKSSLRSDFD